MREDMTNFWLTETNMQQQCDRFKNKLYQMIDALYHCKKPNPPNKKPWIVKKVEETLNGRDRVHKKWQKSHAEKTEPNTSLTIPELKLMSIKQLQSSSGAK